MRRIGRSAALAAAALITLAAPTRAQAEDCSRQENQFEKTECSRLDLEAADRELNLAYKIARDKARQMDRDMPGLEPTIDELLRDAQRAWIPFRDAACEPHRVLHASGWSWHGLYYIRCLEWLTLQRTEDLRLFTE